MADPSAKSFLKLVERSGIVAEDRLKEVLNDLSRKSNGSIVKADELSKHLIDSGVITEWHSTKLKAGRYKGFFLGKYKLLGHLGTGGMSSVYLAEHKVSGQKRAIKVLPRKKVDDKSYLDRFYREGKAAASLNDPNIVRVYDIANEDRTHYMVMEYVQGEDLYELVKRTGPLDPKLAVAYIRQAAVGLQHAHKRNLVHRDIKPANLLLAENNETIKILDLGLALMKEETESLTVLYNEKVMGTADYLSPEQAINSHEVDHRADVYSLGCTLYYLLTGQPPFPDGTLAQRIAMHQKREPKSILEIKPDVPEPLVDICKYMMRKDPDDRPQDCALVEKLFDTYLQTGTVNIPASIQSKPLTDEDPFEMDDIPTHSPFAIETASSSKKRLAANSDKYTEKPTPARKPKVPIGIVLSLVSLGFLIATVAGLLIYRSGDTMASQEPSIESTKTGVSKRFQPGDSNSKSKNTNIAKKENSNKNQVRNNRISKDDTNNENANNDKKQSPQSIPNDKPDPAADSTPTTVGIAAGEIETVDFEGYETGEFTSLPTIKAERLRIGGLTSMPKQAQIIDEQGREDSRCLWIPGGKRSFAYYWAPKDTGLFEKITFWGKRQSQSTDFEVIVAVYDANKRWFQLDPDERIVFNGNGYQQISYSIPQYLKPNRETIKFRWKVISAENEGLYIDDVAVTLKK